MSVQGFSLSIQRASLAIVIYSLSYISFRRWQEFDKGKLKIQCVIYHNTWDSLTRTSGEALTNLNLNNQ